jgi:hypothetical protein
MEVKKVFPVVGGPLYDEFVADWFRYLMLFIYLCAGMFGGFSCWGFISFWEWLASPEILDF